MVVPLVGLDQVRTGLFHPCHTSLLLKPATRATFHLYPIVLQVKNKPQDDCKCLCDYPRVFDMHEREELEIYFVLF